MFQEERRIGEERAAELARLTGAFTLRRTQEIINRFLPARLEWTVFCRPTELQVQLYNELLSSRPVRACFAAASTHAFTHSPHLACINALKKLCNHPGLLYNTMKVCDDTQTTACVPLDVRSFLSWLTSEELISPLQNERKMIFITIECVCSPGSRISVFKVFLPVISLIVPVKIK